MPWTIRSPLQLISSEIEDVISMLIKHEDEVDQVDLLVAGCRRGFAMLAKGDLGELGAN